MKKTNKKVALIFGITGQDGSYLTRLLLDKNYIVHGVKRSVHRLIHKELMIFMKSLMKRRIFLHYGDITDSLSIYELISKIKPEEIYNLSAQSHVSVSFELPEYTLITNAAGTLKNS